MSPRSRRRCAGRPFDSLFGRDIGVVAEELPGLGVGLGERRLAEEKSSRKCAKFVTRLRCPVGSWRFAERGQEIQILHYQGSTPFTTRPPSRPLDEHTRFPRQESPADSIEPVGRIMGSPIIWACPSHPKTRDAKIELR